MFKKKILSFLILSVIFASFCFLAYSSAVQAQSGLQDVTDKIFNTEFDTVQRETYGPQAEDVALPTLIARIINIFLGFLGIIFVIIIIYAGFVWMTAGGNEDKVSQARKWITNSVIGIIIILAAYAITNFVVSRIVGVTSISTGEG